MADLIISIKNSKLESIDLTKGLYSFGISDTDRPDINENTYQLSNRFNNLEAGLYQWAVKYNNTGIIKARGSDRIKPIEAVTNCKDYGVNNEKDISIPFSFHEKEVVTDIECYELLEDGVTYSKFLPDSAVFDIFTKTVRVITFNNFIGKISIC